MASNNIAASERRAEHLLNDLLDAQGWDRRRPPYGDVLFQTEYRVFPELEMMMRSASKTGAGRGIPEAILLDNDSNRPVAVIEAKSRSRDIELALEEAQHYAKAFLSKGFRPVSIALAGTDDLDFRVKVTKWTGTDWEAITYDGTPIGWIPNLDDVIKISAPGSGSELRPSMPPQEVLARRAEEINRLLRESDIRDEFRPAVVAAIMIALWQSGRTGGTVSRDPKSILRDINHFCAEAFGAKKFSLSNSLRVDPANKKLANNGRRIVAILERLNISVLTAEHDYLGQLYETFFRYTGGNTIGQYFTPRHITSFMAEITDIGVKDVVLDPACGSGGFLVAAMDRMLKLHSMKRADMVDIVASQLIGFESEPITAALCVANMILRGDGSTGIHAEDVFTSKGFPKASATVSLINPPFPHKKTDTPAEAFVDKALTGLVDGGRLAVILPNSLLAKKDKGTWREAILKNHRLDAVCQLPDDLFQPFAAANTSIALITKGIPHGTKKKTSFVRLQHDGFVLKKSARVRRDSVPDQTKKAVDAIANKVIEAGFSGLASISGSDEWSVGAYIEAAPIEDTELTQAVDVLLRRLASFYTRYAPEIVAQRLAILEREIDAAPYREILTDQRIRNSESLPREIDTIGGAFEIFYGMKELHSRDGMVPGKTLIISPTEEYNGCYGWLDFSQVIEPPFVTVAQTGSIGEAFVQLEPCAVNDDCLVLLPREGVQLVDLVLAAATLHAERWRFSYGRKLTPQRIADFRLPKSSDAREWVERKLLVNQIVIDASLQPYLAELETKFEALEEAEDLADALIAIDDPTELSWKDIKLESRIE